MLNVENRHPAVQEFGDMFAYSHLPEGLPRTTSALFCALAAELLEALPDAPPLTRALHRVWEAKNEAVFLAVRVMRETSEGA